MKKLVFITIVLSVVLSLLTSCAGLFGGGDNGGQAPDPLNKDKQYKRLVYSSTDIDLTEVRTKIMNLVGPMGGILDTEEAETDGEIVFGDSSRTVTVSAKTLLEEEIAKSSKYDCGYIVYSNGSNIAVYWQYDDMADIAIGTFISECLDKAKLKLTDGIVAIKLYDRRDFEMNGRWDSLAQTHGEELASAIHELYNYYDGPKIAAWIANLYDPEIGGFYYSRSARDYVGFLPDLESTSQALSILGGMGALNRDTMLPDDIKRKIVEFAREMQSAKDGYFYHPQWPQDISQLATDRYGRDSGNAAGIITSFTFDSDGDGIADKQYPKYCVAGGTKCALHAGTNERCSFPVATSAIVDNINSASSVRTTLTSTVSDAVSKVATSTVKPVVSDHPDYTSGEAFRAWLEEYNSSIGVDSGHAHNLAAIAPEIAVKGYGDILIQHLKDNQKKLFDEQVAMGEEPTGVWQRDINYRAVWGAFKYMYIFNHSSYNKAIELEYAEYMIRTCLAVIRLEPKQDYAYNDLMNQWSSITYIMSNVQTHYGTDEANKLYAIVREDPVFLIKNTIAKLEPFKMEDGSFCVNVNGTTPTSIYGVPIAMGVSEGSVNSTNIILNIYGLVCSALGCPKFSLCTLEDGWDVVETMTTCEPVQKISNGTGGVLDFESSKMPSDVKLSQNNPGSFVEIVDNPDGDDSALLFYSPTSSTSGDILHFTASGVGGSCYVFESDMYISSKSTKDTNLLQLKLGGGKEAYMLQMKIVGKQVVISDASSINGDNVVELYRTTTDEWFNLRVEFYNTYAELGTVMIKIYIDGDYITTSSNYYGSHSGAVPYASYTAMSILSLRSPESYVYFDNVIAEKNNEEYIPE